MIIAAQAPSTIKVSPASIPYCATSPRALEAIARVNEHGASNHGWDTWDTIEDAKGRYDDARLRHDLADAKGELTDKDSGLLHAAHRAWGNLAVLELMLREREPENG